MKKIIALLLAVVLFPSTFMYVRVQAADDMSPGIAGSMGSISEGTVDRDLVVVSNSVNDETTVGRVERSGSVTSVNDPAGYSGTIYKTATGTTSASFKYYPRLDKGLYRVYINKNHTATGTVSCTVNHENSGTYGSTTGNINWGLSYSAIVETDNEGRVWYPVGVYAFSGQYNTDCITLSSTGSATGYFSSVKFEKVESDTVIVDDYQMENSLGSIQIEGLASDSPLLFHSNYGLGGTHSNVTLTNAPDLISFVYYPKLAAAEYEVFVNRPRVVSASNAAMTATVTHVEGDSKPAYSITSGGDVDCAERLYSIGRYTFTGVYMTDKVVISAAKASGKVARWDSVMFVPVKPMELNAVYANGRKINNHSVEWGGDSFVISLNNKIDSMGTNAVQLFKKDGTPLDIAYTYSMNKITVNLKETLTDGNEYVYKLDGIVDIYGSCIVPTEYAFQAQGGTNGAASVEIASCQRNGNTVELSGIVRSSTGIGIKGRTIGLKTKYQSEDQFSEVVHTSVSTTGGNWNMVYNMPPSAVSGRYTAFISSDFVGNGAQADFIFVTAEDERRILDEFAKSSTIFEVEQLFNDYKSYLGIYQEIDLTDKTKLYDDFVGIRFTDVTQFLSKFYQVLVLEEINQAETADVVRNILASAVKCSQLGIKDGALDALTTQSQMFVDQVFALDRVDTAVDFIKAYDEILNGNLMLEYNKPDLANTASADKVFVGQTVEMELKLEPVQNDVKEVHYTIECDDAIFEDFYISDLQGCKVEKAVENKKADLAFVYDQPADTVSKIAVVSFTAVKSAVGTHNLDISGSVLFDMDDLKFDIVSRIVKKSVPLVVSKAEKGGSSSSGSSHKTISSGVSVAVPDPSPVPVDITPERETVFDDLKGVDWAVESIEKLYDLKIIEGLGDKKFAPDVSVTREQFVKMIVLAMNKLDGNAKADYSDVAASDWHYPYISSASKLGIVTGKENGAFGVGENITREDMSVIIYRAYVILKGDLAGGSKVSFDDAPEISNYAMEAIGKLSEHSYIGGTGNNMFSPKMTATRAMAAKLIYDVLVR